MKTPIWPYIAVVACLFVLSVLAPRAWMREVVQGPLPVDTKARPTPPVVAPTILQPEDSSAEDSARPLTVPTSLQVATVTEEDLAEEPDATDEPPALAGGIDLRESSSSARPGRLDESLAEFEVLFRQDVSPSPAPVSPPVGEQIKLDISVTESPALPTPPAPVPVQVAPPPPVELQPTVPSPAVERPLEKQPPVEVQAPARAIPSPDILVEGFRELERTVPAAVAWSRRNAELLVTIHAEPTLASEPAYNALRQLFRSLSQTPQIASRLSNLADQARVLRIGYATKRRADIWNQLHMVLTQEHPVAVSTSSDMRLWLAKVEQRLEEAEHSGEWKEYLLLQELRPLLGPSDTATRRQAARKILRRISSSQLSTEQVAVFQQSPFEEFGRELRRWAIEPVDYVRLLEQIEHYELHGDSASATGIATSYESLRWSSQPAQQQLADQLNTHYRNANVRVALTAEFLNRMLPGPQAYEQEVASYIAGADVTGTSQTVNQLRVVLHPDSETWRIGLEVHGEVASDTAASRGPATFYNQGWARYHARKMLMIDRRGVRVWRAEADANSETELKGFETDFDPIPVFGWLARSVAKSQHDQQYHSAKAETEELVRQQASAQFDEQVHARLAQAEDNVKRKLLAPFERIQLKPTPLDMSTTEQRVIARYRLAADEQLGAQTPRPQAPANSLLSVQVHESALNNTLSNLRLDGKRIDLIELYKELSSIFDQPQNDVPEDIPEGVTIQFASQDAVRVRCDDAKVELTIRIAELKSGRRKYQNFAVKAFYIPDADQLRANLVRHEALQIAGDKLKTIERGALGGIFSRALSRSKSFNLINRRLGENPQLRDCHVNQFVINDGWIGVGIGVRPASHLEELASEGTTPQQR